MHRDGWQAYGRPPTSWEVAWEPSRTSSPRWVPRLEEEASAIHAGDVEPRLALWSRSDPVTLFGAVMTRTGWDELEPAFARLARSFGGSESFRFEVMAAGVSGDLGYVAGIERSRAARTGGDVVEYALRVTTILRREAGEWRSSSGTATGTTRPAGPSCRDGRPKQAQTAGSTPVRGISGRRPTLREP